jgi:hypothetical protein
MKYPSMSKNIISLICLLVVGLKGEKGEGRERACALKTGLCFHIKP